MEFLNDIILAMLPNGRQMQVDVNNQSFTRECDYMEECYYKCKHINNETIDDIDDNIISNSDTYNLNSARINLNNIKFIISDLFKEKYFYTKIDLIKYINFSKRFYTLEQIDLALNELMEEPNIILDRYNRKGKLENIGELYIFSPIEVKNDYLKINNRMNPVLNKNEEVELTYSINIDEVEKPETENDDYNIFYKNVQNTLSKINNIMNKITEENNSLKIYNQSKYENIIIKMYYEKLSIQEK